MQQLTEHSSTAAAVESTGSRCWQFPFVTLRTSARAHGTRDTLGTPWYLRVPSPGRHQEEEDDEALDDPKKHPTWRSLGQVHPTKTSNSTEVPITNLAALPGHEAHTH